MLKLLPALKLLTLDNTFETIFFIITFTFQTLDILFIEISGFILDVITDH